MNDQNASHAHLRNTATGALAAVAAVGAIAGTAALAANPRGDTHDHAATATGATTKTPTTPAPDKTHTPRPAVNHEPFLTAVQQLVDNGTITAAESRAVDREILAGRVDTDGLASSGFTETQLQAIEQTLSNTKRALGATAWRAAGGKGP
ncbi:MAG: hypothetical protein ABSG43_13640 [Solirubrobacteraceae bacterium]